MAAPTKGKLRNITPADYEYSDRAVLSVDVVRGQELTMTGDMGSLTYAVYGLTPHGALKADAIALNNGFAGDTIDVGFVGEMGGFTGLVPGTEYYPSATVDGGLDSTQPNGAIPQVQARSNTKIAFNFLP